MSYRNINIGQTSGSSDYIGVHNYYLDFLKSFKNFISGMYPNINNYQFNYSDVTYLNKMLYKEHVQEFPICHINLNDIQVEDNSHAIRQLSLNSLGFSEFNVLQHLSNNNTIQESVLLDFKFEILNINVRINLDNSGEIFNYINTIQSLYPKNMMFYDYNYNAYINIDSHTKDWNMDDDVQNVYYKSDSSNQKIMRYALYYIEPIIKINNISSSKQIVNKGQSDNYVEIDFEVRIKVPNKIGNTLTSEQQVNGITIIIDDAKQSNDMPVLIDMDNDIYSDNRNKLQYSYILIEENFINKDENYLKISREIFEYIKESTIAIYMVEDTSINSKRHFLELGSYILLEQTNKIIEYDGYITIKITDKQYIENINTFNFGSFNRLELLVFN